MMLLLRQMFLLAEPGSLAGLVFLVVFLQKIIGHHSWLFLL